MNDYDIDSSHGLYNLFHNPKIKYCHTQSYICHIDEDFRLSEVFVIGPEIWPGLAYAIQSHLSQTINISFIIVSLPFF